MILYAAILIISAAYPDGTIVLSSANTPIGRAAQRITGDHYTHIGIVIGGMVSNIAHTPTASHASVVKVAPRTITRVMDAVSCSPIHASGRLRNWMHHMAVWRPICMACYGSGLTGWCPQWLANLLDVFVEVRDDSKLHRCLECGGDGVAKPKGWPSRRLINKYRPQAPMGSDGENKTGLQVHRSEVS